MKKKLFIIICLAALLAPASAYCQETKRVSLAGDDDISFAYGQISLPQAGNVIGDLLVILFSAGHVRPEDSHYSGQFSLEYGHWFNKVLSVGGAFVYESMSGNLVREKSGEVDNSNSTSTHYNVFSVLPIVRASWMNFRHVGLYSKAGIGLCVFDGSSDGADCTMAVQISPVCCDFGGRNLRGFVELGFGSQGLVSGGLRYRW